MLGLSSSPPEEAAIAKSRFGSVGPGSPIGPLTIAGTYTQTSAGALNIGLAGLQAGAQYSQLLINGTASLGGTLNVSSYRVMVT